MADEAVPRPDAASQANSPRGDNADSPPHEDAADPKDNQSNGRDTRSDADAERTITHDQLCTRLLSPQCKLLVEDLLPQMPDCTPDELLDLIDAELCRRADLGETPSLAEYLERFPAIGHVALGQLFEIHMLEHASRHREVARFKLPGVVQGTLIADDESSQTRRARRIADAAWGAVRIFRTEHWQLDGRKEAQKWVDRIAEFRHPRVLPVLGRCQCDDVGNLFVLLPSAEGTLLQTRCLRPMALMTAARHLLPIVGAAAAAFDAGIDLGEIGAGHLILDHFDKLSVLGMGALPEEGTVAAHPDLGKQLGAIGTVWLQMIGGQSSENESAEPLEESGAAASADSLRMPQAIAIGQACQNGAYESIADIADDLAQLMNTSPATLNHMRWKHGLTTKPAGRAWWQRWR